MYRYAKEEGAERVFMLDVDNDSVKEEDKMYNVTGANACGFRFPGRIHRYHDDNYLKPGGSSNFDICYARPRKSEDETFDEEFNRCAIKQTGRVYHCMQHFVYDLPYFKRFDDVRDSYAFNQEKYYVKIAKLDFETGRGFITNCMKRS